MFSIPLRLHGCSKNRPFTSWENAICFDYADFASKSAANEEQAFATSFLVHFAEDNPFVSKIALFCHDHETSQMIRLQLLPYFSTIDNCTCDSSRFEGLLGLGNTDSLLFSPSFGIWADGQHAFPDFSHVNNDSFPAQYEFMWSSGIQQPPSLLIETEKTNDESESPNSTNSTDSMKSESLSQVLSKFEYFEKRRSPRGARGKGGKSKYK